MSSGRPQHPDKFLCDLARQLIRRGRLAAAVIPLAPGWTLEWYWASNLCLGGRGYGILLLVCEVDATSMKNDNKKYPDANNYNAFALLGQVGLYIAGGALLGVAAGSFIDGKLHSAPVATLIGLLLGLAVGIYGVFRLVSSLK